MKKTFCDRHPDTQCVNRVGHLSLSVIHQTNKGEVISVDEYQPRELCGACVDDLVQRFLGGMLPMAADREDIPRRAITEETTFVGEQRVDLLNSEVLMPESMAAEHTLPNPIPAPADG
jgi:hypothetical protein